MPTQRRLEISLPTLIEHTSFYQEGTRSPELRDIVPAHDPLPRPPPRARTLSHGRSQSAPSRFLNNVVRSSRHARTASDASAAAGGGGGGVDSLRRMTDSVLATLREREPRAEREEVLISSPIPIAAYDEPGTPTNAHMSAEDKDHLSIPGAGGHSPKPAPGTPSGSGSGSSMDETLVEPPLPPLRPSWVRLYTVATVRERLLCLVPAVACALGAAMAQPYMTTLMGEAFNALAEYWFSTREQAHRDAMMRVERAVAVKITVLGIFACATTYAKNALWVAYGELTANRLRCMVFNGVQEKPMEWYDLGMGAAEPDETGAVGAGGLMGKFAR